MPKLRLGIDVGGTFTDVVAIDAETRALVARVKVPTTHGADEGVAAGIVAGIERLLHESNVEPGDVAFIAHSTTQATNALLEGDVARVGVLGIAPRHAILARAHMRFRPVALAPNVVFAPRFRFADGSNGALREALERLRDDGCEAIAVSQAFSVDAPEREQAAVAIAASLDLFATSGHDVTSLYGLRSRTRTTAINAAILPKMLRTARMTDTAVRGARIAAPLMIMRSDGGVMDVREVERRPILTLLSGPAAGIAGALLYENVTDGIFIEVGGTSADCAAIRNGQPQMRGARIGGHRTTLQTIDSRTLGIGGGSMPRIAPDGRLVDVGPRSAHIAGCAYASFVEPERLRGATVERCAPIAGDPDDYAFLRCIDGSAVAVTTTCVANVLGYVADGDFARGNPESARRALEILARGSGLDAEAFARAMLDAAVAKVARCVAELIADYELDPALLQLIGGGGGASSLVPALAERLQIAHRIARDAEVISPVGVALALVRDVVERTIVNPTPADIAALRSEAADRVIAAGAAADRVDVAIEIDAQRNRVRAIASGATALAESASHVRRDAVEQRAAAALSLNVAAEDLDAQQLTPTFALFSHGREARIVDDRAVVRRPLRDARVAFATPAHMQTAVREAMEAATSFGDVGRALPELVLLYAARIVDLGGLPSIDQAVELATDETRARHPDERIAIITLPREA